MIVENAFTIAASQERVFDALLDLERLVPCLPGARLDGVISGGSAATGQVRLPLGRSSVSYRGTIRVSGADRELGAVSISVDAHELRGSGRVTATVDVRLHEAEGLTSASLRGTSDISGRAAVVEPDVMRRAVTTLLTRFGAALSDVITDPHQRAPRRRTPVTDGLEAAITALDALDAAPAPPIRGVVRIMTDGPIEMPVATSVAGSAQREIADRPWVIPAALMAALALILVLRGRRD